MTVVDGWYSVALVVKYTVGGFRHYLFFQQSAALVVRLSCRICVAHCCTLDREGFHLHLFGSCFQQPKYPVSFNVPEKR